MTYGIAIFDFDKTLIRQGSLAVFLGALRGRRRFWSACGLAAAKAAASAERREIFRAELLRRTLKGVTLAEVRAAAEDIFPRLEWKCRTMDAYRRHLDAGHRILIATGGLTCYMRTLLRLKSFAADGLLATEMAIDGETLTGEMASPSCTWDEKARRVAAWLKGRDGEIWAYGNLPNDAAMLALAHHPVAVKA